MITRLLHNKRLSSVFFDARTISAISSDQNNWDLGDGATFNVQASGAQRNVTGLANGQEGRLITLVNVGSLDIWLLNENTGSSANNRILTGFVDGGPVILRPNQTVALQYNNALQRWTVLHALTDLYDPLLDPVIPNLAGAEGIRRLAGVALGGSPLRLGGFAIKTNGPVGNQAFGTVSLQVSFTMQKPGSAIAFVVGCASNAFPPNNSITTEIGARFDSDTPQKLNAMYSGTGAGGDAAIATQPLFGFWPKSGLTEGPHTADLCWGGAGTWSLLADSTYPAIIAVFHTE